MQHGRHPAANRAVAMCGTSAFGALARLVFEIDVLTLPLPRPHQKNSCLRAGRSDKSRNGRAAVGRHHMSVLTCDLVE